jgi:hypothetical protein
MYSIWFFIPISEGVFREYFYYFMDNKECNEKLELKEKLFLSVVMEG